MTHDPQRQPDWADDPNVGLDEVQRKLESFESAHVVAQVSRDGIPLCGVWLVGTAGAQAERMVTCDRAAGHDGAHGDTLTGITWGYQTGGVISAKDAAVISERDRVCCFPIPLTAARPVAASHPQDAAPDTGRAASTSVAAADHTPDPPSAGADAAAGPATTNELARLRLLNDELVSTLRARDAHWSKTLAAPFAAGVDAALRALEAVDEAGGDLRDLRERLLHLEREVTTRPDTERSTTCPDCHAEPGEPHDDMCGEPPPLMSGWWESTTG